MGVQNAQGDMEKRHNNDEIGKINSAVKKNEGTLLPRKGQEPSKVETSSLLDRRKDLPSMKENSLRGRPSFKERRCVVEKAVEEAFPCQKNRVARESS